MGYSHLRLNIHDLCLYIVAFLLFILFMLILYFVYRYMDKVVTRSAFSSRKTSVIHSSKHDFYLIGEAQPETAVNHTPDLSSNTENLLESIVIERSSPVLTEHEKKILEIHCEECEKMKESMEEDKISNRTTIFLP